MVYGWLLIMENPVGPHCGAGIYECLKVEELKGP